MRVCLCAQFVRWSIERQINDCYWAPFICYYCCRDRTPSCQASFNQFCLAKVVFIFALFQFKALTNDLATDREKHMGTKSICFQLKALILCCVGSFVQSHLLYWVAMWVCMCVYPEHPHQWNVLYSLIVWSRSRVSVCVCVCVYASSNINCLIF